MSHHISEGSGWSFRPGFDSTWPPGLALNRKNTWVAVGLRGISLGPRKPLDHPLAESKQNFRRKIKHSGFDRTASSFSSGPLDTPPPVSRSKRRELVYLFIVVYMRTRGICFTRICEESTLTRLGGISLGSTARPRAGHGKEFTYIKEGGTDRNGDPNIHTHIRRLETKRLSEDISSLEKCLDQSMDKSIEKLVDLGNHAYQVAPLSSNVTQSLQEIERKLVSVVVDNLKNMQTIVLEEFTDMIDKSKHSEGSADQTADGDGGMNRQSDSHIK
ncbi:Uncharacterized protein Rs2_05234 [Raphanus sativus]|nr:Uncharacterized protein Rs2_05234 [Raphanus sativus]